MTDADIRTQARALDYDDADTAPIDELREAIEHNRRSVASLIGPLQYADERGDWAQVMAILATMRVKVSGKPRVVR